MADQTVTTSADTFLDEAVATTNQSSVDHLNFRGSQGMNPIWTFDVSSLVNKMWDSVTLNLTFFGNLGTDPNAGGGVVIYLAVVTPAVVITQTTWNVFSTGNNWPGSSGAESGTDNDHGTRVAVTTMPSSASTDDTFTSDDITDLITRALNVNAGTLQLIMYSVGSNSALPQFDSIETTNGTQATLQFTNVENQETTTTSNPDGAATNVAVPSATATSKSGRPPIAGADRQVSASIIHDGPEPMTILAITLKGQFGADN